MAKKKDNNTESKILEAAKEVFQTKGMDGARMHEIANLAGINKSMLHYYYRSKQLLFEAVFKNAFSLIAPKINAVLNDDSSIEDKIKKFTSDYITFIVKHPYLPNFIILELNRNPEFILTLKQDDGFPNLEKFKKQIDTEVKKGLIRPIKGEQLFINLMSLSIFPFIASPLIKGFLNIDDTSFNDIIKDRKTIVADFIINAIKL